MTLTVRLGDPRDPEAAALLSASHALMQRLYPAEANHYLSVKALCAEDIRFVVARDGAKTVGCGALALKDGYGELKSMFVATAARGTGAADALMRHLENMARDAGLALLRLETGDTLHAAHRLYSRHGFTACGPFGDYSENPHSLFMEKAL